MKKILITGSNSYIGTSVENWLKQWPEQYKVDTIDMVNGSWRLRNFAEYDTVFHVAGIAHVDTSKVKEETQELYFKINRDLTIEVAAKAKNEGVMQFIFMSSIIIYGESSDIGGKKIITKDTVPNPSNFYGDSKLQAEKGILPMQSNKFNVLILRPPMIYGKDSKGNYPRLSKLSRICPIFPNIENERSMLYIDNLCEFVRLIIDNVEHGIFYPQNREYTKTSEMVRVIGLTHGKKIYLIKWLNPFIKLFKNRIAIINKVFGNLVYDKDLSDYQNFKYCVADFKESIFKTELE